MNTIILEQKYRTELEKKQCFTVRKHNSK